MRNGENHYCGIYDTVVTQYWSEISRTLRCTCETMKGWQTIRGQRTDMSNLNQPVRVTSAAKGM